MRILLDECIDESFRHHFTSYDCQTCRFAGFKGLANGKLIAAAFAAEFDVLITVDQNLPDQQNRAKFPISIVVLRARTTNLEDLVPLVPSIHAALESLAAGGVIRIG